MLEHPVIGRLASLAGRFSRYRLRLAGFTNPFYVSHHVVDREGARYVAPAGSYLALRSPSREIVTFADGRIESEVSWLLAGLVRPGDTVLDIGANVGLHTVAMAKAVPQGKVFAFEPVPAMAERLSANCALNGLDNVVLVRCGLGAENAELEMHVNRGGAGMEGTSSFLGTDHMERHPENYAVERLPVRRLDELMITLDPPSRISFIKMDTEGFEPLIIDGARETFARHRPAMLVEAHSTRLRKLGRSFMWYVETFPDYHVFMVPAPTPANPFLQLVPLTEEPGEVCHNLLLLPRIASTIPV
ncbi:hypothetical protein A6A04_03700 [Paramagnetospirillum marisnigri]|uniref:Methyltransferase FkbM domain-containing protein n=1 Tax=Paramagnetospirillum marisnigri TaxID=1285242 RepID=A0A178MKV4_9PROT|nr:FkbM family methyltransferase [Paramagnetospirillum marisnigri]OAN49229.1 hypothetical protein A6A04_03700 [Paramagnetospirillum marisnigri]